MNLKEGMTVPERFIPAGAWGMSARALTAEEVEALDPFGGDGIELLIPEGRTVAVSDVQDATGIAHVTVSAARAWADGSGLDRERREAVKREWKHWLSVTAGE